MANLDRITKNLNKDAVFTYSLISTLAAFAATLVFKTALIGFIGIGFWIIALTVAIPRIAKEYGIVSSKTESTQ